MSHPDHNTEGTPGPRGEARPATAVEEHDRAARRLIAQAELVRLTDEVRRMEAEVEAKTR